VRARSSQPRRAHADATKRRLAVSIPEAFTLTSQRSRGVQRLTAAGEMDLLAATRLRGCFDRLLPTPERVICVDLRAVTSPDARSLNVLAYMNRRAANRVRLTVNPTIAQALAARPQASSRGIASLDVVRSAAGSRNDELTAR
jgi:hypothetical protein